MQAGEFRNQVDQLRTCIETHFQKFSRSRNKLQTVSLGAHFFVKTCFGQTVGQLEMTSVKSFATNTATQTGKSKSKTTDKVHATM